MNGDLSAVPPVGSPWVQDGMLSNGRVEGNIVFDNGPGGAAINMDGVSHSYIVNNVLTRSFNNSGIAVFVQNGARASHNNLIAHNSIGMHSSAGWGIIVASPAAYSNEICNNVCYTEHSWRGSIAVAAAAIAGLRCDYNAVMNRFSSDAGGTRIDLAQWRALGYGSNSILATPAQLYVTPSTDVHLRSNAPAIDAGCVLADVDADLEQRPRPLDGDNDAVAAADIGAYEFVHPIADTDGDGQPDRIEGVLGTDATDRRSRFAVRVAPGASNAPVLRWPSASGVTYAIDRASRADGAFVELGTGLAAEPSTNTFTVPGTNVPAAFFRVRAQSPAL